MKKVFYILNLLFLTLLVSGGSVFAADLPTQYILANGITANVPPSIQKLSDQTFGNHSYIGTGWYYIDDKLNVNNQNIALGSTAEVNIVVAGTPTIDLGGQVFAVPKGATLNFWVAANTSGTDANQNLTITGNNGYFVIGNTMEYASAFNYSNGDFGNITFNSGSYNVNNSTTGLAIGSPAGSGGSITVNQEAEVTALSKDAGTTSIGVTGDNSCTINVSGGILRALYISSNYKLSQVINVGEKGSLTLDNQGYIVCTDTSDQTNWNLKSGIVAVEPQTGGTYNWGIESPWDAYVYGEVSIPTPQGVELTPPVDANTKSNGYYNTLTIDKDAQLTLGNEDQIAQFFVSDPNSIVNNNGDVIINSINQIAQDKKTAYTHLWNNNPGSTLTVNSGATLNIWKNGFNNLASEKGQSGNPGEVAIEGILTVTSANGFQNEGTLNIAQGGLLTGLNKATQVVGIAGVVNNPGGTVTLDGTIELLTDSNYSFQNSGNVNVGPIGTVNGNLTNNTGGTVTSENDTVSLLVSMGEV